MRSALQHPATRMLVFSHAWLAGGAMAQVWWAGRFLHGIDIWVMLAVGSALISAYGAMRIVRTLEPDPIPSPWIAWVGRNRKPMVLLVLVTGVLSVWLGSTLHRVFAPYDVLVVPATLGYLLPWHDKSGRSRGLRQVPYIKAPLIAMVWAFASTGFSSVPPTGDMHSVALDLFLLQSGFFLGLAIAFDGLDLPYDNKALRTVPQWFGAQRSRYLAALLMLPWTIHLFRLQMTQCAFDPALALPMLGYLLAMPVLLSSGARKPGWYGQLVMDGLLLFIPLLGAMGVLLR